MCVCKWGGGGYGGEGRGVNTNGWCISKKQKAMIRLDYIYMCSLIITFAVCICLKDLFLLGPTHTTKLQ